MTQPVQWRSAGVAVVLAMIACFGCASKQVAPPKPGWSPKPAKADAAAMDRFRALEGTWTATYEDPSWEPAETTYRTIAAGSAVVETIFAGQPHEMITVYFLDGDALRATHYCAAQNQPNLVAETITPDVIEFGTLDVTDLESPDAMYMGGARFEWIDDDHFTVTWTSFENGEVGKTLRVQAERVKPD